MKPTPPKIVINGAPSQLDRLQPALSPGYAPVDGRPLDELLDFPVQFGRLIYFYSLDNQVDGDWSAFFVSDPALLIASICRFDLSSRERELDALVHRTRTTRAFTPKFELLREVFAGVQALGRRIDDWFESTLQQTGSETLRLLHRRIAGAIDERLGKQLRLLKRYAAGAALRDALHRPIVLDWHRFAPNWEVGPDHDERPDGSIYRGHTAVARVDASLPYLVSIFAELAAGIGELQNFARDNEGAPLLEDDHPPQIGLYIAFANLFRAAQATVNQVSSRYEQFYYRDILREQPAGAISSRVYLNFLLAPDEEVSSTTVPAGTLFIGGKDAADQDILYVSERSVSVYAAQLAEVHTLLTDRGPLVLENSADPSVPSDQIVVVRQILGTDIALPLAIEESVPWTTFGANGLHDSPVETTAPAQLGFAVASIELLLSGGTRNIQLTFRYSPQFKRDTLDPLLARLSAITGRSEAEIFRVVLQAAFRVFASTTDGWFELPPYAALIPTDADPSFLLLFELPPTGPPIGVVDPTVTDGADAPSANNPAPTLPTLKFYLRQERIVIPPAPEGGTPVEVFPLSLLHGMPLESFGIAVSVDGLSGLQLQNTDGEIDSGTPFSLLGSPAVVGSYLDIGHPELFSKRPRTLKVAIAWFNLPPNDDGFKGYYRDYVIGLDGKEQKDPPLFDNYTFRVSIAVRNPGLWSLTYEPDPDGSQDPEGLWLFHTREECNTSEPAKPLCQHTEFTQLQVEDHAPQAYYNPADSTIRISLIQPPYGFGDDLYALNVLAAVLADLPDAIKFDTSRQALADPPPTPSDLKYPNAPWLPTAQEVSISYTTDREITSVNAESGFFHLLPFGGFDAAPLPGPLLPLFENEGHLYLGFTGLVPPLTLTLLFQMVAAANQDLSAEVPFVSWEYCSSNRWVRLDSQQILADSTSGLRKSGILAVGLPPYDPTGNTILPTNFQWLRATVIAGASQFPNTVGIYPNAVSARWQEGGAEMLGRPLPAHSISSSVQDLPYIESIDQPMASFGGRAPETAERLSLRLGERLRHKDRAIAPWDYERLVLEQFPVTWKVQVLPACNDRCMEAPGDVLVVVVAGADSVGMLDPTAPMASPELLDEIRISLQRVASPFVQVHVVNPVYVRICVWAKVQFAGDEDVGTLLARLNDDLIAYLSPWYYDAARAAKGGEYVMPDEISEFIQTRPYVQALWEMQPEYDPPTEPLAWYFLTSALSHQIEVVDVETAPEWTATSS